VEWIHWVPQAELGTLYSRHDAFLFPSLHDSSGTVVLEAMSHGLPVICFDLGGPGVLVTARSGIVVPTDGRGPHRLVDQLAKAMRAIVDSPDRRGELQAGALARARELTWTAAVQQLYGEGGLMRGRADDASAVQQH
jgi:glycosyltransferase involved in cell wall biosynthesis